MRVRVDQAHELWHCLTPFFRREANLTPGELAANPLASPRDIAGIETMRFPAATKWSVIGSVALLPLLAAAFTGHAWEDFFITLRSSLNLVNGHGLVFNPGERVHTFTSPLGVLLPALALKLTGSQEIPALWVYRVMNAAALALAAWTVWRRFDSWKLGPWPRWIFFGLLIADAKLTDFSMNGMETGLLVGFTLLLWSELEAPTLRPSRLALATAGLMWTRPDACVLIGALCLPAVVFRDPGQTAPRPWKQWLSGLAVGALLYLPWFVWAWWYYGSPVPNTIIAKSQVMPSHNWTDLLLAPWHTLLGDSHLIDLFLPTYSFFGNWPSGLYVLSHLLSVVAAFCWLIPRVSAPLRRVSLTIFLGMFYLCAITPFPWYPPPWAALAYLVFALAGDAAVRGLTRWKSMLPLLRVTIALVLVLQVGIWAASLWQMRQQQRLIENSVRRSIGLWLREQSKPGDTVFLEPLGYIGFYSGLKTYDYPGLSSPEVVQAIRRGSRRLTEVIGELKPTWLVLRPFEIADARLPENAALRDYEWVRTWNVEKEIQAVPILPGRAWLLRDSEFSGFRRRAP